MKSKYELSISTNYVKDWGITEAFRELFQNAIDNEISNPDNKMEWDYNKDTCTIRISNKNSCLSCESLLLGESTKSDDKSTIGKFGEGYKIAFVVLLRNNKTIKVYNYGNKEIWEVKLVKSKRYNGAMLPTIIVNKAALWETVPNNNLTIEVNGISEEEYKEIVKSNLHLRENDIQTFEIRDRGKIILDKTEIGNIYVRGLYVTHIDGLNYGYDFEPSVLGLDRDRKLVDSFNICWESSILWAKASDKDEELNRIALDMVFNNSKDVQYVSKIGCIEEKVSKEFYDRYGEYAVPVTNNNEYKYVKDTIKRNPVIVSESIASMVKNAEPDDGKVLLLITIKEQLSAFASRIKDKLSEKEYEELEALIEKVGN